MHAMGKQGYDRWGDMDESLLHAYYTTTEAHEIRDMFWIQGRRRWPARYWAALKRLWPNG